MPLFQHLKGIEQLLSEHILAPAVIALRRKNADCLLRQLVVAEVRLASPDREEHVAGNAELLLDGRERSVVLRRKLLTSLCEARNARFPDIVGRRLHELGLSTRRRALPSRQIEVRQRKIWLHSLRRRIEGPPRYAERLRLRPETLQPPLKQRIGRISGYGSAGNNQRRKKQRRTPGQWPHLYEPLWRTGACVGWRARPQACNDSTRCRVG